MAQLIPVDHDPFASAVAPSGPTLTPVDHDPFAPVSRPNALSRGFVTGMLQQNPETAAEALEGASHLAPEYFRGSLQSGSGRLRELAKLSPEAYKTQSGSMWDIRGLDDALTWVGETIGQGAASTVPSLVMGGAGAGAGALVAGAPGAVVGAGAGAMAGSYPLNYGEVYKALKEEKVDPKRAAEIAGYAAVPMAALDAWNPAVIVSKFAGVGEARREVARGIAKRIAAEIAKGGRREALTEAAQEAVKDATVSLETGKPLVTEKNVKGWIESGVAGGLTGAAMSGPAGIRPDRRTAEPAPAEQAAPAPAGITVRQTTEEERAAPIPQEPAVIEPEAASQSTQGGEQGILRQYGYSDEQIAGMSPQQRANEVRDALDSGIEGPTAQPTLIPVDYDPFREPAVIEGGTEGERQNNAPSPVPESNATLVAQQAQILAGDRAVQMFPAGHPELPVPGGLERIEAANGDVFHYDPDQINPFDILTASNEGRENELLGLGPVTKIEAMQRVARGEQPVAVTERTPEGIEVRGAAGTNVTAPAQVAALNQVKSPDSTVQVESPEQVISDRISPKNVSPLLGGNEPFDPVLAETVSPPQSTQLTPPVSRVEPPQTSGAVATQKQMGQATAPEGVTLTQPDERGTPSADMAAVSGNAAPEAIVPAPPQKKPRQSKPRALSITEFIARNGGLRLDADVRAMELHKVFVPGAGPLARKNGRSLDGYWREALMEAGYLPTDDGSQMGKMSRDIKNELRDLVMQDRARGGQRVYSIHDQDILPGPKVDEYAEGVEQSAREILTLAEAEGRTRDMIGPKTLYEAAELLYRGEATDPRDALEQAYEVHRAAAYEMGERVGDESQQGAERESQAGVAGPGEYREDARGDGTLTEEEIADLYSVRGGKPDPRQIGFDLDPKPKTETVTLDQGAKGEQYVIPGAEQASQGAQAQRRADAPLKPTAAQKPVDFGLFGDGSKQTDLIDAVRKDEKAQSVRTAGSGELPTFIGQNRDDYKRTQAKVDAWLKEQGAKFRSFEITRDVKLPSGDVLKNRRLKYEVYDLADGRTVTVETNRTDHGLVGGGLTRKIVAFNEAAVRAGDKSPSQAAPEPAQAAPRSGIIEDFGEKIGGAKKDAVRDFADALGGDVDIAAEPLSKIFPQPDYENLAKDGVAPKALAYVALMRDEIPSKPRKGWKLKGWVSKVSMLRDVSKKLIDGEVTSDVLDRQIGERYITLRALRDTASVIADIDPKDMNAASKWRVDSGHFSVFNGEKFDRAKNIYYLKDNNGRMVSGISGESLDAIREPALKAIRDAVAKQDEATPERRTKISLYLDRKAKDVFLGFKGNRDVIRLRTGFKDAKEARAYLEEHADELQTQIDEMRRGPSERRETNDPRSGVSRRVGDVTPDQFSEAFGFRGVQFGNYVEGDRRQQDLNDAFDALMDLSSVLGIPSKALALNGQLGMAFGARGSGRYAAHYEPGKIVINLTKTRGAGSLAHEWLHALDNYFSKQDAGKDGATPGYMSERKRSEGLTRDPVYQAWKAVEKAISGGEFSARAAGFDAARSKPYWNTTIEKAARSFERYIYDRLQEQGTRNDYLANINLEGGAYPTEKEMREQGIREAFDNLFRTMESRSTDKGVELFSMGAWHGSPHQFDRFRLDNIGSGEGAQAYGWGLYFAGKRAVAEFYRTKLSSPYRVETDAIQKAAGIPITNEQAATIRNFAAEKDMTSARASQGVQWRHPELRDDDRLSGQFGPKHKALIEAVEHVREKSKGRLFKVNLTPKDHDWLDWDKKISEQSDYVQKALASIKSDMVDTWRKNGAWPELHGKTLYQQMARDLGGERMLGPQGKQYPARYTDEKAASLKLRDLGIPGIKYLDESSRGPVPATMQHVLRTQGKTDISRTRNFVVFDDALIEIEEMFDARRDLTVKARNAQPELKARLSAIIKRIAGDHVRVAFPDQIELPRSARSGWGSYIEGKQTAAGAYVPAQHLIRIALNDPQYQHHANTAVHESFHAVEHLLLNDREMAVLKKAEPELRKVAAEFADMTPEQGKELADYEVRAIAFEAYAHARGENRPVTGLSGAVRVIFERLRQALQRVRNALNGMGFKSANDVFSDVYLGKMAGREANARPIGGTKASVRETPQLPFMEPMQIQKEIIADQLDAKNLPKLAKISRALQVGKINTTETRAQLQDKFIRWKKVQEAAERATGRKLPEAMNVYQAESLYYGRTGERLEKLDNDHIDPLIEDIKKRGLTLEQVDQYLMARHAPERNRELRKINPDIADPSGMSDERAQEIIEEVEGGKKAADYRAVEKRVRSLINETRNTLLKGGLISQAQADAWSRMYENYVPLRGWQEGDNDTTAPEGKGTGRGFDVRGPESKKAMGRSSVADSPLGYVMSQAQQAIVRAEKNKVGLAALRFVQNHPDSRLWQVDKGGVKRVIDPATGLVTEQGDPTWIHKPNVFSVKIDGKPHYINFKGDYGANLARALKNLGSANMHAALRFVGTLTRIQARLATSWNPDFMIPNFIRDAGEAFINLQEQDQKRFVKQFAKHLTPAIGGSFIALRGKDGGKYAQAFREFDQAGGRIRFFGLENVDDIKANIASKMRRLEGGAVNNMRAAGKKALDAIEVANGSIENATRLAAFMAARDVGLSPQKAASIARELTVNFNRKGELGSIISSLYMFANAAIQGQTRMLSALYSSRRVKQFAGGLAAVGASIALYNIAAGGDDDDGVSYYTKIPHWVRDMNLVLMWPKGMGRDGQYVKIQLPYGYAMFYVIGSRSVTGGMGKDKPLKAIEAMAQSVLNGFDPLGHEANFFSAAHFAPSIVKPFVQVDNNTSWTGRPINPVPMPQDKPYPDSSRSFRSASEFSKSAAEALNKATGGTKREPGLIDWGPGTIDHMLGFVTGGTGRFVMNSANTAIGFYQGTEWQSEKTPIVRRFYGQKSDAADRALYFEARETVKNAHSRFEGYKKDGDGKNAARFSKEHRAELAAYPQFDAADKQRNTVLKQIDAIKANDKLSAAVKEQQIKPLEKRELEAMARARKALEVQQKRLQPAQ